MIPLVVPLLTACAPWGEAPGKVPAQVELGRPYDPANPFAKVVRHESRVAVVYEDRRVIAFMDYAPASPGHVLVISKTSRARNLLEVDRHTLARLMAVAARVGRAEMAGLGADGFVIEQNNALPQSVPHLHIHVIPRYAGYNRCRSNGTRQPLAVLQPFADRLAAAYRADRGEAVPPRPADDLGPGAHPVEQPLGDTAPR